jgi:hypothetical protein
MDINDTIIDVLIRKLNEDIPSNILLTESGFWPTMGKNINTSVKKIPRKKKVFDYDFVIIPVCYK